MNIVSAKFLKGIVQEDELLDDGTPQIAFVGRSNVGKSSVINSLTGQKNLAKTSSFPGRTQQINVFAVSARGGNSQYWADLPGYGFAKGSKAEQERLQALIYWYLLDSHYVQEKVVLIIDANIGATNNDLQMLHSLKKQNKAVIIVANKVDKIKSSAYKKWLGEIREIAGGEKVIPYSAEKNIGISELLKEIFI
jgi:GTP-binding protein